MACGCSGNCSCTAQIPRGPRGLQGEPGAAPQITFDVTPLNAGEDPTVTQTGADGVYAVTLGIPESSTGAQGPAGTNGINAFTTLASAWTMPAVGSADMMSVADASWIVLGQPLQIAGGSWVIVQSVPNTVTHTFMARNPHPTVDGYTNGIPYQDAAGTVYPVGTAIVPRGRDGRDGAQGEPGQNGETPETPDPPSFMVVYTPPSDPPLTEADYAVFYANDETTPTIFQAYRWDSDSEEWISGPNIAGPRGTRTYFGSANPNAVPPAGSAVADVYIQLANDTATYYQQVGGGVWTSQGEVSGDGSLTTTDVINLIDELGIVPEYDPVVSPTAGKIGNGEYDLRAIYQLTRNNGGMKLSELYSTAQAKEKFKALFYYFWEDGATITGTGVPAINGGRPVRRVYTEDQLMSMYHGPACHNEAYLQDQFGGANKIIWPTGFFPINFPCMFGSNHIVGQGTFICYDDGYSTNLSVDLHNWIHPDETEHPDEYALSVQHMDIFQSHFVGQTAWTPGLYTEGFRIEGFRLMGNCQDKGYNDTFGSNGIYCWGPGEVSYIDNCYAYGFNDFGFVTFKATPLNVGVISSFRNCRGAFGIRDGGLATINIESISCDDNPAVIRLFAEEGEYSGGKVRVGSVKSEQGNPSWSPGRPQLLLHATGAVHEIGGADWDGSFCDVIFDSVEWSISDGYMHSMIVVEPWHQVANPTTTGKAAVRVNSISVIDFAPAGTYGLVHDLLSETVWRVPDDGEGDPQLTYWHAKSLAFTFIANGSTTIFELGSAEEAAYGAPDTDTSVTDPGAEKRYGIWDDSSDFNDAALPAYDPTFGGTSTTLAAKPTLSANMIRPYGAVLGCTVAANSTATLTGVGFGDNGQRPDTPAGTWGVMSGPVGTSVGTTTDGIATLTTGAAQGLVQLVYVSGSHACTVWTRVVDPA